jgi:hypothetical protein
MQLYEIKRQYLEAIMLTNEDWILTDSALALLDKTELEIKEKSQNIIYILNDFDSKTNLLEKEIERLTKLKTSISKNEDKLKDYLKNTMLDMWISEIETDFNKINFRKSTQTIIEDDSLLNEYKKEKITYTIDKTAIKKDIEAGKEVKWAYLEIKNNLQIK